jgi:hypothetical protein
MTTPVIPTPDDEPTGPDGDAPGAEIGMTEDGGGTFEPEEDPGTDD